MDTAKLSLLRNAMTAYAQRRRALSSNIANLDTPEYDRVSVSFEEDLRAARSGMGGLDRASEVEPHAERSGDPPSLEKELMALSDTQMRTRVASRALREHYSLMQTAVKGRSA